MAAKARFSIRRLSVDDVRGPQLESVLWVFGAALGLSLRSTRVLAFGSSVKRHTAQPGFIAYGAFNLRDKLVGFGYGYSSQPGLWWREQITPLLTHHQRTQWLADTFELAELHVHPVAQGNGLGGRLLDRVMTRQPHSLGLLSVMHRSARARSLYMSRGWGILIPEMRFPTEPLEAFSILGWRRPTLRPAVP